MKKSLLFICILFLFNNTYGQINAKLMRHMDVSDTQITFVYGGDIWVMAKAGGTALQVTHSPGEETWPRFSPDGKSIAFTANYNGNADVYVMPVLGGVPTRLTYNAFNDRMIDWHPDGEHLLFASAHESGRADLRKFYLVHKTGGFAKKLSVPYGELASYSPDGNFLAYITRITESYPMKRTRSGFSSDIIIYDLRNDTAKNVTNNPGTDGKPAWVGDKVYYLSDQAENMRLNIWVYDTNTSTSSQVTNFDDFDIAFMSAGSENIVFEVGGTLYLMELASHQYKPVAVNVVSDLSLEMPHSEDVSDDIINVTASPGGKRIVFETRGELFNVPADEGYTINMTRSSDAFDQFPAWSPDGKYIAYWSDQSGEYQVYLQESDGKSQPEVLTRRKIGFGYQLFWSPNSKKLAFIDETNDISVLDVKSKNVSVAGNTKLHLGHDGRLGYSIAWSPDSSWISFSQNQDNFNNAIVLYDVERRKLHQASSGFYNDSQPVFSTDGKYLFYLTSRNMSAMGSELNDETWIYTNTTQIASLSLTANVPSLLHPKNDAWENAEKEEDDDDKDENGSKQEDELKNVNVEVDFDQLETRLVILPPKAGGISRLMPFEGKLIYLRASKDSSEDSEEESSEGTSDLISYDLLKREEETIIAEVNDVFVTSDGKSLLVNSQDQYGIIKPKPKQEIETPIPTDSLVMELVPRQEWRQIFEDTWRRYRDFFYDPDMQQVDWVELRDRYGALIEDARTRWDVGHIQSSLIAELSAGHTYAGGDGDVEEVPRLSNGFLGMDWEKKNNLYRIKRIVKPATWNTEVRSPFDRSGVDIKAGDYILSVNGVSLDPKKPPYAVFEGLSGKTVSLIVSSTGKEKDGKQLIVQCLTLEEETSLRYLEWVENNRKMVDKLSNGQLGYIYMSDTGERGQSELISMFYGQLHKKGFIIDERFNAGGSLADRFLELLQRPVVYNLHWRHGKDYTQPLKTNTGPMGMLINGWAGSGGDGLPWAFQELKAGPIVGENTLGILVGPASGHSLIDGGVITVPGARLYDNDGHWFWEGVGVSPDIPVWDDPNMLVKGRDPQMERVVEEVLKLLKTNPPRMTPAPPLEDRTAKGLNTKK